MHYKLIVTEEMERLLDEHVGYSLKEFKSNQAACYILFIMKAHRCVKSMCLFSTRLTQQKIYNIQLLTSSVYCDNIYNI